jgi:signal transduction histidine kinase
LWGNRDAITTAIQNLITNAAQASGDGGTVRVHTRVHETRSIEIEVSDDGPGIPPQLQREIFAPFFSTRAAGAGLGLAVVQAVARAHDGDVRVRSRPGHGAAFSLILPALGIGESAAGSGRHGP